MGFGCYVIGRMGFLVVLMDNYPILSYAMQMCSVS
jgi:hypothetical protein